VQRLTIEWRQTFAGPRAAPLIDDAGYWTLEIQSKEDELYLRATGFADDGDGLGEHVVPWVLVRSASARPLPEETPGG